MILRAFRSAWRRLVKRPGYMALSVAVLGVGLGVVLFGFSALNVMVLQPLPFPHANRLVSIGYANTGTMDSADFTTLRAQMQGVDAIGAFGQTLYTVGKGAAAHPYGATTMTASMFAMLGVQPKQGRGFEHADEQPGAALTVLLSDRVWRRQFQADKNILGRSIMVSGQPATVIGVMPKGFAFPFAARLWLPSRLDLGSVAYFKVVARLKPGTSMATARTQLQGVAKNLGDTLHGQQQGNRLTMSTLTDSLTPESLRARIRLMFGAGLLVPLWLAPPRLVFVAVRTHADPLGFTSRLAGIVHKIDPLTPVFNPRTQAKAITMGRIRAVIFVQLFTAMGLIALLLAAAGLYGVLAFAVAQRTREIGIRRAIGAGNGAIVREVGRTLAWQLGLGLLIGGLLALPWSSLLADPNLHARAHDPSVFVPVLLLVIGVSVLSALVPLARALRVDPAVALRYE